MLCEVDAHASDYLKPYVFENNDIWQSVANVLETHFPSPKIPAALTQLYRVEYKGRETQFCSILRYVVIRMFDPYFYQQGMKFLEQGDTIGCAWSMLRTAFPYASVRKRISGLDVETNVAKQEWYIYGRLCLKMGVNVPFDLGIYKMSLFYLNTKAFVSEAVKMWLFVGKKLGVTRDIRIMIGNAIWRTVWEDTDAWCRKEERKLKKIKKC